MHTIIQPTIDGMAAEGHPYVGVLFAGLMLTDQGRAACWSSTAALATRKRWC
jgi:phosphoribosylamine-glycine ligase